MSNLHETVIGAGVVLAIAGGTVVAWFQMTPQQGNKEKLTEQTVAVCKAEKDPVIKAMCAK